MPKTTYVWDELSDNVIEEYEDGVLSVSYDHEPGLYGNLLSQNRNGVTSYYHYDGRGDTVALTADSGNVTDTKEYDAWGNVLNSTGSTVTPYQFASQRGCQSSVGGIYARGRIYEPLVARMSNTVFANGRARLFGYLLKNNSPILFAIFGRNDSDGSDSTNGELRETLDVSCPYTDEYCGCRGPDCWFEIKALFRSSDAKSGGRAELCFDQGPGTEPQDPPGRSTSTCTPEINRTANVDDHFTITLLDGTPCKFTSQHLPPDAAWPPTQWPTPDPDNPQACVDVIRRDADTRCYVTTKQVKSITVKFSIEVSCGCVVKLDEQTSVAVVNHKVITLNGTLP